MATAETTNYWPQTSCARAFWGQQELPAYRELLADTTAWLCPQPGQRWLDLGCGCGRLSAALWRAGGGTLAEVVGLDCAAANAKAYARLRGNLHPPPGDRLRFVQGDFSSGLEQWPDEHFDGIVSGLAIQYAESYSPEEGRWTSAAYDRVLEEVWRLLRPGGRFVFSVNVPEPSWGKVALGAFCGVFRARKPLRYLKRAWRLWTYGGWLKREARRGRFHYLTAPAIVAKLTTAGLDVIEQRLSFAGQAYLFRCQRT
jgi:SAM-dependent methyltransferase